ncbi:MAG: sialidase family protein [Planctomycetota bacterium]|nr:sialidase family protein [Planctomycetota bacterium]
MKAQATLILGIIITLLSALPASVGPTTAHAKGPVELELLGVQKVWDKAPHNAFTDLVRFKGKWYLTFREAKCHMYTAPAGDIRVLTSEDGENWESAALIKYGTDSDDLRDSKLSVTPDGKLMMVCALAPKENHKTRQSYAYLSDDGVNWKGPHKVGEFDWWMWRVVWSPDGTAYGLGYGREGKDKNSILRLYRSKDGIKYKTFLSRMAPQDRVNEAAMIFRPDGSAVVLIRRDGKGPTNAVVGTSKGGDFSKWTFKELEQRIGGPQIVEIPGGHILASGRLYDGKVRTSVGLLEPEAGKFTELLKLPSGGDTSYPGMVFHDGILWVSYYASHEGRTSIYLAKIKVKE